MSLIQNKPMYFYNYSTTAYQSGRVSVIIPTFNRKEKTARAVKSVLKQTYHDIEIIVADDGSTDNTIGYLNREFGNRVVGLSLSHHGHPNHGRNEGILVSTGEFISFLDSDDQYEPDKIQKQVGYFVNNPEKEVVYCDLKLMDERGFIFSESKFKDNSILKEGDIFDYLLWMFEDENKGFEISLESMLIKKTAIHKSGLLTMELKYLEDWEYILRLSSKSLFGLVRESLVIESRDKSSDHYGAQFSTQWRMNPALYMIPVVDLLNTTALSEKQKISIRKVKGYYFRLSALRQVYYNKYFNALYYAFKAICHNWLLIKNYTVFMRCLLSPYYTKMRKKISK